MISALGGTGVPVPRTLGLCTDDAVNGAPFYVMSFVEGHIVRDERAAGRARPRPARARAGESLIDTLAELHAVDVDAVGPRGLRPPRRLHRAPAQAVARAVHPVDRGRRARAGRRRPGPRAAGRPDPRAAGRGHRPRRLPAGQHRARRRRQRAPPSSTGRSAPWATRWPISACCWSTGPSPRTATRRCVGVAPTAAARIRHAAPTCWPATPRLTGRDVSEIAYYRAFGFWKLACILQGVHVALRRRGRGRRPLRSRPVRRPRRAAGRAGAGRSGVAVTDHDPSTLYRVRSAVGRARRRPARPPGAGGRPRGLGRRRAWARRRPSPSCSIRRRPPRWPSFDTELLIDQRARRPIARLEDGVTTELTWPAIQVVAGKDRVGRRHPLPDRSRARLPVADLHRRRGGAGQGPRGAHGRRAGGVPGARPPTPDRSGWPRPSRPSRRSWPGGWAPCTAPSRCRPASRPRSRWRSGRPGCRSSACGPGSPTTCRPCPTPRPARRSSRGCVRSPAPCSTPRRCAPRARRHVARSTS